MKSRKSYLQRWGHLSFVEKITFAKAVFTLLVIKLGLIALPFSTFRKIYNSFSKFVNKKIASENEVETTVWAVKSAANFLPLELLCLPRALATKYLLRHVHALTLEIGVEINAAKVFEAHAWVEKNGLIIIGDWPESVSYRRLWVWE